MNPLSFINENYTVEFQSENLSSPEEAEIVLLCETHSDEIIMSRNAQLIDLFVEKSKWVLVEGVPSMVEIDQRKNPQSCYVKGSVEVMGWDRGTVPSVLGCSPKLTEAFLEKDRRQAEFLLKRFGPKDSMNEEEVETLESEFMEFVFQLLDAMQEEENFDFMERTWNSFQGRNQAMIETLEKTKHSMSQRFVIAGEFHLVEKEGSNDPRTSITPLRDYLRDKKAVILRFKPN